MDVGWQLGAGLVNFASNTQQMFAQATPGRQVFSVSYIFNPGGGAGTYLMGFAVMNTGAQALNNNDVNHVSVLVL